MTNKLIMEQARRRAIRWHLLQIAEVSRPQGIYTEGMLPIIQTVYMDATELEVRRELDYLEERELVKIKRDPMHRWFVELTRVGIDLVQGEIDCEPGIGRPINYFTGSL